MSQVKLAAPSGLTEWISHKRSPQTHELIQMGVRIEALHHAGVADETRRLFAQEHVACYCESNSAMASASNSISESGVVFSSNAVCTASASEAM